MGLRGPNPKSAEQRILEGERAHRPLPQRKAAHAAGVPDRPKGMTAAARRVWDGYVAQLAGSLRLVDGFALRRLCEDVALLEELQTGMRKMAGDLKRDERPVIERLKAVEEQLAVMPNRESDAARELEVERTELQARRLSGGAMISLAKTHEGRRITATISSLSSRIARQEMQFGLTPASASRVEGAIALPMVQGARQNMEERLAG